ncbi:cytochrome P450 12b1, mitochondrial-like isoform X2 [Uranotaenia lowii]|uniref:cytochrome P450 12b1, mitochondrial-like isoform X2 n=1 Tax=Uranotaenia lowii TaxID=190385 RepID=UPI00247B0A1A|nr:cytochrome P450 12b1, mitochondrial-like isoform X2 [Uranotaenia lowii]
MLRYFIRSTKLSTGKEVLLLSTPKRWRSAQLEPSTLPESAREIGWTDALPYQNIPGPGVWQMFRGFAPGGRYYNATLPEMHRRLRADYGDLIKLPAAFGRPDILMSYSADDYQTLFRTEGHWPVRQALDSFVYYRKVMRPHVFKMGGLVSEQGEDWQQLRSVVNPVLMQPKTVKQYIEKVNAVTMDLVKIMQGIRDAKNELPADFNMWLNRWALETIGVIALDTRFGVLNESRSPETEKMVDLLRELFVLIYKLDIEPSLWKLYKTPNFKRMVKIMDELTDIVMKKVDQAIQRLGQNPTTENLSVLEKLLKVNRDVAVVMAVDMLMAGVDTTSSATVGILHSLATNPEKQQKLREELRTILPRKDSPLTVDNMRNLPYLRACIKEGMRIAPPTVGNARNAGQDIVLQGYQVPKGTNVVMAAMTLNIDDRHHPRAKEYLPERWLKEEGYPSVKDAHPFVFLPFGFGPRTCIGRRLAQMEMEIVVARITRQFEYRWNYGPLRIKGAIVNVPENELKFEMVEVKE